MLILLAACTSSVSLRDEPRPRPTVDDTDEVVVVPGDTAPPDDEDTAPEPETWPKACDDLYAQDTLPEFDLSFSPEAWSALTADCSAGAQTYRPARFTYDGETVSAMVRLKGNWSWSCDKMQFIVSFNEKDPDARFHGLRKIMLDAPWYDRTLLHERVAFPLFAARGLPHSCVNNARLTIDGAFYGLYANVERIDHEYLERNFEDPSGNLYQGGSELKTNEDVGDVGDLTALQSAHTADAIAELVDLDEAIAEWAVEAVIPAMDNYWAGVEINYYLYDNPGHGFQYLPYDLDLSFGDGAYTDGSLVWPEAPTVDPITWEHSGWQKEQLLKTVLNDPARCAQFVEAVAAARDVYVPEDLAAQVATWDAQIASSVAEDTRSPFSAADHAAAVAALTAFFTTRADFVDTWLADGGHCPVSW